MANQKQVVKQTKREVAKKDKLSAPKAAFEELSAEELSTIMGGWTAKRMSW